MSAPDTTAVRDRLLAVLAEDPHNRDRLLSRLDAIGAEAGIGACSALLLILTRQAFDEDEARSHWTRILERRERMSEAIGRDVGLRVALLDYFLNENLIARTPSLVDLEMREIEEPQTSRDPLTGLAGDRAFRAAVMAELRRGRRHGFPVAVALFDLDGFAAVNAVVGELVGDRLLREAAIVLGNKVRDIDLAARPGEDEFALLLPGTDRLGALVVAERFRAGLAEHFRNRRPGRAPVGLTVSGGVAAYPVDAVAPEDLLERAARALYRAKALGKDRVEGWEAERRSWLRFDLEPGRFEVEVLAPREVGRAGGRDVSRRGLLFASPEPLDVGEVVEVRLRETARVAGLPDIRLRGRVVRLEEIPGEDRPDEAGTDRYEIGVSLDPGSDGEPGLVELLDRLRGAAGAAR